MVKQAGIPEIRQQCRALQRVAVADRAVGIARQRAARLLVLGRRRDEWPAQLPRHQEPGIDQLIELIIQAPDREPLVARTKALDRVLLWRHYVVPHYRLYGRWIASWDRFSHPPIDPKVGYAPGAWWVDPQKDTALRQKCGQ
jgi:hypothetical protein